MPEGKSWFRRERGTAIGIGLALVMLVSGWVYAGNQSCNDRFQQAVAEQVVQRAAVSDLNAKAMNDLVTGFASMRTNNGKRTNELFAGYLTTAASAAKLRAEHPLPEIPRC